MTARIATAALLLAAAFATLASLLLPDPGSNAPAVHAAPAAVVVHHTAHAGGTAVSQELDADRAFLADLTDGATDLPAATADSLIATAHRICDSRATRADWLASLTVPGPHALTDGEATKLVDTAQAAFCPELSPWGTPRT